MKQLSKKKKVHLNKKFIARAIVIMCVVVATFFGFKKARYYQAAADQAQTVQIRELILLAVRGLKKDAPVEAQTGNVYFPESRLFLPNPRTALALTYLYDSGNITDSQSELSISTYPVRGSEALYSAKDNNELFAAVPHLQACSRGIKLVYHKYPHADSQNQLTHTVRLSNNKDLYVYLEKDCPELTETANLFVNIRSY